MLVSSALVGIIPVALVAAIVTPFEIAGTDKVLPVLHGAQVTDHNLASVELVNKIWKLNFTSKNGHGNACPGLLSCLVAQGSTSVGPLGLLDQVSGLNLGFIHDLGNSVQLSFTSEEGHDKICPGQLTCFIAKGTVPGKRDPQIDASDYDSANDEDSDYSPDGYDNEG